MLNYQDYGKGWAEEEALLRRVVAHVNRTKVSESWIGHRLSPKAHHELAMISSTHRQHKIHLFQSHK